MKCLPGHVAINKTYCNRQGFIFRVLLALPVQTDTDEMASRGLERALEILTVQRSILEHLGDADLYNLRNLTTRAQQSIDLNDSYCHTFSLGGAFVPAERADEMICGERRELIAVDQIQDAAEFCPNVRNIRPCQGCNN